MKKTVQGSIYVGPLHFACKCGASHLSYSSVNKTEANVALLPDVCAMFLATVPRLREWQSSRGHRSFGKEEKTTSRKCGVQTTFTISGKLSRHPELRFQSEAAQREESLKSKSQGEVLVVLGVSSQSKFQSKESAKWPGTHKSPGGSITERRFARAQATKRRLSTGA